MDVIDVGSIIKSYDFCDIQSCYMIGEVIAEDDSYLTCRTIKAVFDNQTRENPPAVFRTLRQGLSMFDEQAKFKRVVLLG